MAYNLGLVELYWDYHHGRTNCTSKNIDGQFMIIYNIELYEFYNKSYKTYKEIAMNSQLDSLNSWKNTYSRDDVEHIIRKMNDIYGNDKYHKLEIIKMIELEGLEQVAIVKTIGLKIIQRKWRNHLKKKRS